MSCISSGAERIDLSSFGGELLSTFGRTPTDLSDTLGVSTNELKSDYTGAFHQLLDCQMMLDVLSTVGGLVFQPTQELWRSLPSGSEKRSLWNTVIGLIVARQAAGRYLNNCKQAGDERSMITFSQAMVEDVQIGIIVADADTEVTLMSDDEGTKLCRDLGLISGESEAINEP